jgi:dTDP-4-amino-4,6-dideoxygalactose transaminase
MFIPASSVTHLDKETHYENSVIDDLLKERKGRVYKNGRTALLSGSKILSSITNGRFWLPAYLCQSAITPVNQCNFEIRYYDVSEKLEPKFNWIHSQPNDILIIVHYFGIVHSVEQVMLFCSEKSIFLIEDCAHSLSDIDSSVQTGSYGDIAIFSFRKQLPVPDGGLMIVNNSKIGMPKQLPKRSNIKKYNSYNKQLLKNAKTFAFKNGINIFPIIDLLKNFKYHKKKSSINASEGPSYVTSKILKTLNLKKIINRKKNNYRFLSKLLSGIPGIYLPFPVLIEGSVPQCFPIWVSDPGNICYKMRRMGIEAARWPGNEYIQNIDLSLYPGTERWLKNSLCLPVNDSLNESHMEKIAHCLKKVL